MARSARQAKILEIIQQKEIETQEELAKELRELKFNITQATISRDIKELGLIKIMTPSKKYKYAYVESTTSAVATKYAAMLKNVIISLEAINNTVLVKTLKDMASSVCATIDKLGIEYIDGTVYGFDTVLIICRTNANAMNVYKKINEIIE